MYGAKHVLFLCSIWWQIMASGLFHAHWLGYLLMCNWANAVDCRRLDVGGHCADYEDAEEPEASAAASWSVESTITTIQTQSARH